MPPDALPWTASTFAFLAPHLPPPPAAEPPPKPHLTLTFATSLDSMLAARPGAQTVLSGPQSKAMTHYLRSRHAAILIGVGTALADDPGLNCRLHGAGGYSDPVSPASAAGDADPLRWQPRPVILDPTGRWHISPDSKLLRLAAAGKARAPWILTGLAHVDDARAELLAGLGGAVVAVAVQEEGKGGGFAWEDVLAVLAARGVGSVMVEGGAAVINGLLGEGRRWVDGVVVTVAPRWLGRGGVGVCPEGGVGLAGARWVQLGEDVVVCGTLEG